MVSNRNYDYQFFENMYYIIFDNRLNIAYISIVRTITISQIKLSLV